MPARGRTAKQLAVLYTPVVPALQLVEASAGRWGVIWVMDSSMAGIDGHTRVLARLGRVADVAGLDAAAAAEVIASFRPSGIMAFDDSHLVVAARIARLLDLPANSPETAIRATNKLAQRTAFEACGLPGPRYWSGTITSGGQLGEGLLEQLRYPVIVKPQQGSGSEAVSRADSPSEMQGIVAKTRATGRCLPFELIIEQLLPDCWPRAERPYADVVSVESVVCESNISHLVVTGRATFAEPYLETGNFIPSNLPADAVAEVLECAGQGLTAINATTGVFHTEVKWTPGGPRLIEINGRIGGAGIPEMLSLAGGPSIVAIAAQVALGECLRFDQLIPCSRVGYSFIAPPPVEASRVTRIENLQEVRQIPGVVSLALNRQAGERVDWREGFASRVYSVYGAVDDHDELWKVRERIVHTVRLEFD